jgi:hypothetical protein
MYLRLGDFLGSCVPQLVSRKATTHSLVFPSDQVRCSRIVRFIVTGHDGTLPVDGALLAAIVPHSEIYSNPRAPHCWTWSTTASWRCIQMASYVSVPVACPTEKSGRYLTGTHG